MFNYYHLKRKLIVWYYTKFVFPYDNPVKRKMLRDFRFSVILRTKSLKQLSEQFQKNKISITMIVDTIQYAEEFSKLKFFLEHQN